MFEMLGNVKNVSGSESQHKNEEWEKVKQTKLKNKINPLITPTSPSSWPLYHLSTSKLITFNSVLSKLN